MSNGAAGISDNRAEDKATREVKAMPMNATVLSLSAARTRHHRIPRAIEARRRLERRRGRVWINGRELGGPDQRYAHLGRSHD